MALLPCFAALTLTGGQHLNLGGGGDLVIITLLLLQQAAAHQLLQAAAHIRRQPSSEPNSFFLGGGGLQPGTLVRLQGRQSRASDPRFYIPEAEMGPQEWHAVMRAPTLLRGHIALIIPNQHMHIDWQLSPKKRATLGFAPARTCTTPAVGA